MPVAPRGSGYLATVHFKTERLRRQFNTKAEAEGWELDSKSRLMRGELPIMGEGDEGAPANLETLLDQCYKRHWAGSKGERTSLINANRVIKDLGNISPSKVTTQALDALIAQWQREGTSNATINRRLAALSKMLTFALGRGYITAKPKFDRLREKEGRIRFFSQEEEKNMLAWFDYCDNQDMKDLVILGLDTGFRKSELLNIEGRDRSGNMLTTWKTKNGKPRSVPLTKRAQEVLSRRIETHKEGLLFPGMTHDSVRHHWDSMREQLGFADDDQYVFHVLRHTFVSRLVQRGVPLKVCSELAGHLTIITTMRYAKLAPHNLTDAINLLEPDHA
ncbi:site-specific integrase [Ottowia sp.]|uniref:tyrosine-type recombinase/integrase n=2 Tax=Ottowia sp. TaxID=1898956 RepID=UPI0025EA2BB6|nr:site-specific integrase [Ottowia sp.]MBK6748187.1 site-specific integrase [Ottowia sp.]